METILAGDIGGTNTRLALYDPDNLREPIVMHRYGSGDYESLQAIVQRFYADLKAAGHDFTPKRAGFGVAGPVTGDTIKLTNLPWVIDTRQIRERNGLDKATFLNDFAVNCLAVTQLAETDLHPIGGGSPIPGEPKAVLGAGTGLGEGFLIHTGTEYIVVPSEGGHADFAPRNALEIRLLEHLSERYSRVSYERVLSGQGLVNVYEFFRDREGMTESTAVREQMRSEDPAAVISRTALAQQDRLCERALELFCILYGAEAGNLALKVLAKLEDGGFRSGFEHKGRYAGFLETVPTYVIVHPQPGLMGAAIAASRL